MYVLVVSDVSEICCKCFIWILQRYIQMLHMLQWLYTYVAIVCSKCFICFRRILQVFYLDVAYTCMLQVYVLNISVILNLCCKYIYLNIAYVAMATQCYNKSSMLRVFYEAQKASGPYGAAQAGEQGMNAENWKKTGVLWWHSSTTWCLA